MTDEAKRAILRGVVPGWDAMTPAKQTATLERIEREQERENARIRYQNAQHLLRRALLKKRLRIVR